MSRNSKLKSERLKLQRLASALLAWFVQNARDLAWRRTRDPYAIWISEIMLQQTQVKTVIPYWKRWMRELPTVQELARARPEKVLKLWEGLGYYARARNLQKAAKLILKQHGNKFPQTFDEILTLPGVGRYTAGAICSIAFNQPTPVLDGNVIRVLTRLYGIAANPREKKTNGRLWQLAGQLVTQASLSSPHSSRLEPRASHLNQSLMELGAVICTPRSPRCLACPIKNLCVAFRLGRQRQLPSPGKSASPIPRRFVAFVVERCGRFLVRKRPAGVVNAHLWEFPNLEVSPNTTPAAAGKQLFGKAPISLEPFYVVEHSITRSRIRLEAHRAFFGEMGAVRPQHLDRRGVPFAEIGIWLAGSQLEEAAFTGAHRKILLALEIDRRKRRTQIAAK